MGLPLKHQEPIVMVISEQVLLKELLIIVSFGKPTNLAFERNGFGFSQNKRG